MLPSDLLFSYKRGAQVYPRFLRREQQIWAEQVLNLIREHQHRSRGELQAALREMPRHYREAIILVGALGESYLDAARILDCDIGTIKSRVNRARAMLREVLKPAF